MSEFDTPETPVPSFEDAFSEMESALDQLPEGAVYTIRHESNAPVYVPAFEGESITIRQACERRGLTLGASVNAYVDGNNIPLDSPIQAGAVVTLVGAVKGGR